MVLISPKTYLKGCVHLYRVNEVVYMTPYNPPPDNNPTLLGAPSLSFSGGSLSGQNQEYNYVKTSYNGNLIILGVKEYDLMPTIHYSIYEGTDATNPVFHGNLNSSYGNGDYAGINPDSIIMPPLITSNGDSFYFSHGSTIYANKKNTTSGYWEIDPLKTFNPNDKQGYVGPFDGEFHINHDASGVLVRGLGKYYLFVWDNEVSDYKVMSSFSTHKSNLDHTVGNYYSYSKDGKVFVQGATGDGNKIFRYNETSKTWKQYNYLNESGFEFAINGEEVAVNSEGTFIIMGNPTGGVPSQDDSSFSAKAGSMSLVKFMNDSDEYQEILTDNSPYSGYNYSPIVGYDNNNISGLLMGTKPRISDYGYITTAQMYNYYDENGYGDSIFLSTVWNFSEIVSIDLLPEMRYDVANYFRNEDMTGDGKYKVVTSSENVDGDPNMAYYYNKFSVIKLGN